MASGYTSRNVLKAGTSQAVGASATSQVVSNEFAISAEDRLAFRCDLTVTGHSGTVSAILETSHDGVTWVAGKSLSVTGDGNAAYNLLPNVAGDQTSLPLRPRGRMTITTAGASGATITAVWVATTL